MKNFNKIAMLALVAIMAVSVMESCKKVSIKKVDGVWTVVSFDIEQMWTDEDGDKVTWTRSFNGSTETVTTKIEEVGEATETETESNEMTIEFEFMKKEGTYTQTTVSNTSWTLESLAYYTSDGAGSFAWAGLYDRSTEQENTNVNGGTYSVTGGSGDIKKNSQLVLVQTSSKDNWTDTYAYMEAGETTSMDPDTMYVEVWNSGTGQFDYEKLGTAETGSSSNDGASSSGMILNVDELKGGAMDLSYDTEDKETDSDGDITTYTDGGTYNLEEVK